MELKPYQQEVINDLEAYLEYYQKHQTPGAAFNEYWKGILGEFTIAPDGTEQGMRPYRDNIPGAIHVAIKVPTAGGKTFIACNALHTISQNLFGNKLKTVVWLVPWSNLLQQTVANLSNPNHPYRQKLNALFGNRVEVYEKEQLLQGANFNPTTVTEQLNILVFSFSSLRINPRKQDDRKIYQQNGHLEAFRNTIIDSEAILPDTEETALINVIRSLNPVVVVDESHNAESDLSVEMLKNLNPSLVLDLTATPKQNSNIISFASALALKRENMVKLPVTVYNHHKKEEVISSALNLQRQLELLAEKEAQSTGKHIRPIVLFQAQSNIKGKDNTTFDKIKEKLLKLKIPEEQIKIKVSGRDELKNIDLNDKDCPVRYIITVNALKEGWDCPNAYILASLADKSSAVDVEQILGRILRLPYTRKHSVNLLNLSFVLTASSKFRETLDNIIKGLQESGFSRDDYYAEELPPGLSEDTAEKEEDPSPLFAENIAETPPTPNDAPVSDDDFEVGEINFNPEEKPTIEDINQQNPLIEQITQQAEAQSEAFDQRIQQEDTNDKTATITNAMGQKNDKYAIDERFQKTVQNIKLAQFFRKNEVVTVSNDLFADLNNEHTFLNKQSLMGGFNLAAYDANINFNQVDKDVYQVDLDEHKKAVNVSKVNKRLRSYFVEHILSKTPDKQKEELSKLIVTKLKNTEPIHQKDLIKYVNRILDILNSEQISDLIHNEYHYTRLIQKKIDQLKKDYVKDQFFKLIDANEIIVKEHYTFPEKLTLQKTSTSIQKSLYEKEAPLNKFEQQVIFDIAGLDNVVFWHRNLERGKGFYLNGYYENHYPDFIIYTTKGSIILLETKGDYLDNDQSQEKNELGKKWAEKQGDKFKYFMVFETKQVPDTYTHAQIVEIIERL